MQRSLMALAALAITVGLASGSSAESPDAAAPTAGGQQAHQSQPGQQQLDDSTIYRGLELQSVQLAYQIHEAQQAYRAAHGTWAEYQSQLEEGGYLRIPAFMLQDANFRLVAMHDLKAPGLPVSSYEAEICVRDPQSGWQHGCVLQSTGRVVDIADTYDAGEIAISANGIEQTKVLLMGSVWPRPLLCNSLPVTVRLKEEILAMGTQAELRQ